MTSSNDIVGLVSDRARQLGFDAIGITSPDRIAGAADHLAAFVADGRHGEMTWMEETLARRSAPSVLWPDCRSIVLLGMSYAPAVNPLARLAETDRGVISAYAKGRDYHDLIKGRLKEIAGLLARHSGEDVKVFVDTAPLMEKPLAASAGLGWQGKHTNLVSRDHGSWLLLGAIMTAALLPPSAPHDDLCGTCTKCLDICPTSAFPAPYQLDARRCIAYLTIEYHGHIPEPMRAPIGNRVFGCDDCLAICPWNKFAAQAREQKLHPRAETDDPPLHELIALTDAAFRKRFAGTPIKRTGRDAIVRNALIAVGNAGNPNDVPRIRQLITDPSPLVRAMAVWALGRIIADADADAYNDLKRRHIGRERDPVVLAEWARPIAAVAKRDDRR